MRDDTKAMRLKRDNPPHDPPAPERAVSRLATDPHLHLVLCATVLTGLGLWWWQPAGFAEHIAADPWRLIGLLLLYPVVEEWLFRGILQRELLRLPWARVRRLGLSRANLLTSLAFALAHMVYQPWGWALSVFIPSLVLGHFLQRYQRLWLVMGLHGLFNLSFLLAGWPW